MLLLPQLVARELERGRVPPHEERHGDGLAGRPAVFAGEAARVRGTPDRGRDGSIGEAIEIGDMLGIERQPRCQLEPSTAAGFAQPLDVRPRGLRVDVVDRDRRDAAPVVDAGVEQAREVVVGEVRRRLHVPGRPEHDARRRHRPELVVDGGIRVAGHARSRLGAEVLHDHLTEVSVLVTQRLEGEQRVDPLLAGLADADQDAARERDRELTREPDRLEAAGGHLVGRGPVGATLLGQPLGDGLEHDPHRCGDRPQHGELVPAHDAGIQVRQQARLVQHELRAARKVLECRGAAARGELPARHGVAKLRLVTEREQRLRAAGGCACTGDLEHLRLAQERPLATAGRPRKGAVAADVAAERGQRNEDLRRVRDDGARAQPAGLRHQVLEAGAEKLGLHLPTPAAPGVALRPRREGEQCSARAHDQSGRSGARRRRRPAPPAGRQRPGASGSAVRGSETRCAIGDLLSPGGLLAPERSAYAISPHRRTRN